MSTRNGFATSAPLARETPPGQKKGVDVRDSGLRSVFHRRSGPSAQY